LKNIFNIPTGFSDHTEGILIPMVAVALGANVIEKHFTLDKGLPGPDHKLSLEPYEFKEMVKNIRIIECVLGDGVKKLTKNEEEIRKVARRSIVAKVDIPKGVIINRDMIKAVRPGVGIEPKYINLVIGKRAKRDIAKNEILRYDDVE